MATPSKSKNIYKQKLYAFLKARRVQNRSRSQFSILNRNVSYTHVSLDPEFKGKFSIGLNDKDEFLGLYQDALKFGATLYLAERPSTVRSFYLDIDIEMKQELYDERIKLDSKDGYTTEKTDLIPLYNQHHLRNLVKICHTSLKRLVKNVSNNHLICYVLTRRPYKKLINGVNHIKSGFHLHFPYVFITQRDLKMELFPSIKRDLKSSNLFSNLNIRDSSSLLDEGVINNSTPWMMYGSTKANYLPPYEISLTFDHQLITINLKKSLEGFFHYDTKGKQISFRGDIHYHLPSILSINSRKFGPESLFIKSNQQYYINP